MHVHRSAGELVIQAPAKLNLFFEVLAKRADGYHEIETLMCPIDLYDTLHFQEDSSGEVRLRCRRVFGAGGPGSRGLHDVTEGPDNLVMRAVELVRRRAGVRRGARLLLVKRIPAAAGLGGGSSDAAAALVAANEGWRLGRSRDELAAWAAELGSDVPFFLAGTSAVCRGRGERVEPVAGFGALKFFGCVSAGGPVDGGGVRLVSAGCGGAVGPALVGGTETRRLETSRAAAMEPLAAGRRSVVALGGAAAGGVLAAGLPGARNEREWHVVLWIIPPCSPCAAERTAIAGKGARRGVCRAKLPLSEGKSRGNHRGSREAYG